MWFRISLRWPIYVINPVDKPNYLSRNSLTWLKLTTHQVKNQLLHTFKVKSPWWQLKSAQMDGSLQTRLENDTQLVNWSILSAGLSQNPVHLINNLEMVRMVVFVQQDPKMSYFYDIEDSWRPGFSNNVTSTCWVDMMLLPSEILMTAQYPAFMTILNRKHLVFTHYPFYARYASFVLAVASNMAGA